MIDYWLKQRRLGEMRRQNYTYCYEPELYKFILGSNILNKKKHEHLIFKDLVAGYSCTEISNKRHYSERTIHNRRKDIYTKTKKYMI